MAKTKLPYISPDIVQQYEGHVAQTSGNRHAKRKMGSLQRFFDWAHELGHSPVNPFQQPDTPFQAQAQNNQQAQETTQTQPQPAGNQASQTQQPVVEPSPAQTGINAPKIAKPGISKKTVKRAVIGATTVGLVLLVFLLVRGLRNAIPTRQAPAAPGTSPVAKATSTATPTSSPAPTPSTTATPTPASSATPQPSPTSTPQVQTSALDWVTFENGSLHIGGQKVTDILFSTGNATNGDIDIKPDGSGSLNLTFEGSDGDFVDVTNPNLTTGTLIKGTVQNDANSYDLLRLYSGTTLTTKFTVNAVGDVYAGRNIDAAGVIKTGGTERISSGGELKNITGYTQTSGNFTIADGELQLGRFSSNPTTGLGEGSLIYNTGDDKVYVWNGSSWSSLTGSSSGSSAFSDLTGGTNTSAAMIVGTGASLTISGSGTINATSLSSLASTQFLRSDTSDSFTSGTLTLDSGTTLDIDGDLAVADTDIAFNGATTTFTTTGNFTLTSEGTITFTGLDCTGNSNVGDLTADATGVVSCSDDDSGGSGGGWTDDGSTVRLSTASDFVAIGASTADGKLGITGARTGQALVTLNETGDQNIISASASGTTVFQLARTGNITTSGDLVVNGGDVTRAGGNLTLSTTSSGNLIFTSAGNFVFTGLDCTGNANGGALTANASGVVSCSDDNDTGGGGGGNWSIASGAIYPVNETVDLLVGGTASSSAKFAVLNVDSGTPTASVSAGTSGAAYLTADGNLATTATQNLKIGGSTTGSIIFQPNTDTGDYLVLSSNGTALTLTTTDDADLTLATHGTGDLYFINSNYRITDTGDITLGGRIIYENGEYIANETDDFITFVGAGGSDNTDLYLDLDGTYPVLYSNTDTKVGIDDDLEFVGGQTIRTSAGDLTIDTAGSFLVSDASIFSGTLTANSTLAANGTVNLGDGGDAITIDSSSWDISSAGVGTGLTSWTVDSIIVDGTTIGHTSDTDLLTFGSAVLTVAGDVRLADTYTLEVGGKTGLAYNAFADASDAPEEATIDADNDLYIGGSLEVDGIIYGDGSGLTNVANSSGWTDGGTTIRLATASDFVAIGASTADGKLGITGARTGQALFVLNETGDQNIFSASASGTTVANLDRSGNLSLLSQGDIRLFDSDNSNYTGFQAPSNVTSTIVYTLPQADGSASQVLSTNSSGVLSWIDVSVDPGTLWNAGGSYI